MVFGDQADRSIMMTRSRRKGEMALIKEDRLSSLPDALLTHILSFVSTQESFCTSFLSTRWKHLFASVPALSFGYFRWQKDESFVKFVNDVLRVHNVLCIKSFKLSVDAHCLDSDVYSWICAAVSRNPRRIELYAQLHLFLSPPVRRNFPLPLGLFTCQMLVHLSLVGNFFFGVIESVRLPSLKTLIMRNCKISDGNSASRLFSSCTVLEDLTFYYCVTPGVKVISISAPSLKSLKIYSNDKECELELNVPNLEYIRCEGSTAKWSSVTILKSLRKADVRLYSHDPADEDVIWELVNKFDEVQLLSLLHSSMESLARDPFSLPVFNKLTTLELLVDSFEGWNFFRTLVKRSPNLECLVILEDGFSDYYQVFPQINVLLSKRVPLCFSRSLKEVTICITEEDKVEDEWLRYLLKNAKVLEKLTIFVTPWWETDDLESEREALIRKKLLAFPRGSKTLKLFIYISGRDVHRFVFGG